MGLTAEHSARPDARVAEIQRRRLVGALIELAAAQGLQAATIGGACRRASVSRRTFYELFADREACLLAALDVALERLRRPVVIAARRQRTWVAGVRAGLAALLVALDSEPQIARLLVIEAAGAGPTALERRRRALEEIAVAIDAGRSRSRQDDALSPLSAEGVVGGALAVVQARLLESAHAPLIELLNPLTALIVHPYLGARAARRELERPVAKESREAGQRRSNDPFKDLPIRLTYRTTRVLATIASKPGASNRAIGAAAEITDGGQTSRLLKRLQRAGLVENHVDSRAKGEPNSWSLTHRGQTLNSALES